MELHMYIKQDIEDYENQLLQKQEVINSLNY